MKKPQQGLSGTFTIYGPPPILINCGPLVTQAEKDTCKKQNGRVIESPMQSPYLIRNVGTDEKVKGDLDGQGSYRVNLAPGTYEFCLGGECSDPLEVAFGQFATYGQRLPRAAVSPPAGAGAGAGFRADTAPASR